MATELTYDYEYTNTNGSGAYYPISDNELFTNPYYYTDETADRIENYIPISDNLASGGVISPAESKFKDLLNRIMEFHKWLEREQESLEEESGADLSGVIDKLEETFSELSEEINCEHTITYLNSQLISNVRIYPGPPGVYF
jgi:hypothetical protein